MEIEDCLPDQVTVYDCYCGEHTHTCRAGNVCSNGICLPVCQHGYDQACLCGSRTYGSKGLTECKNGEYCDVEIGKCAVCDENSDEICQCAGSSIERCEICQDENNLDTCATCLPGHYLTFEGSCAACVQENCEECVSEDECFVCKPGFYEKNNMCIPYPAGCEEVGQDGLCLRCSANSYEEGRPSIDLKCQPCSSSCNGCVKGYPDRCTSCSDNAIPENDMSPKKCMSLLCREADWENSCCATCGFYSYISSFQISGFNNCKMCPVTPFAEEMEEYVDLSACYCGDGYANCGTCNHDGGCLFCKSGYRVGSRPNSCDECTEGFASANGRSTDCSKCADGFFPSKIARAGGIKRIVKCTACTSDLNIQNQECVCNGIANCEVCDVKNSVCAMCRFGYSGGHCDSCKSGYTMIKGVCVAKCDEEMLVDNEYCGITVAPASCPHKEADIAAMPSPCKCGDARNCANCVDHTCGDCMVGYKHNTKSCDKCNDGFWELNGKCVRCPSTGDKVDPEFFECVCGDKSHCLFCHNDKICGDCVKGYELKDGVCVEADNNNVANIAVGCVAGVLALLGIVALVFYCLRHEKKGYEEIEETNQ